MINLCSGWEFAENWSEELLSGGGETVPVRLPHTVKETPLHYAGPQHYEGVYGYRRALDLPESLRGRRLFLQFDGAAHIAEVFFNGVKCAEHRCGYTAFRAEITDYVNFGGDNTICVRLDCTENPAVPPFGFVIDYLTYGGLYREVWLDVRERLGRRQMPCPADRGTPLHDPRAQCEGVEPGIPGALHRAGGAAG